MAKHKFPQKKLYIARLIKISVFVVLVILVIMLALPMVPEIQYSLKVPEEISEPDYPVSYTTSKSGVTDRKFVTDGNRLFIPKIGVDTEILEGPSEGILNTKEGVWREPFSTNPTEEGNMVIAGHRFQYLPPNTTTLYHLDKLLVGDIIKVYWEGEEYSYKINKVLEVNPEEVWIRDEQVDESIFELTLYTCTPIYTSEKRLVVKATLV